MSRYNHTQRIFLNNNREEFIIYEKLWSNNLAEHIKNVTSNLAFTKTKEKLMGEERVRWNNKKINMNITRDWCVVLAKTIRV